MKANIIAALDGEREYQDRLTKDPERPDIIQDFHIGDGLSAIQFNLEVARKEWYYGSVPHEKTMDCLRKIAAICIKLGEMYGMPERKF